LILPQTRLTSFVKISPEWLYHYRDYFPAPETPFVLNLAAQDEDEDQRSVAHCRRALDLSAEIGVPFFAAHAGFAMQPRGDQLGPRIARRRKTPSFEAKDISLPLITRVLSAL
tara:strand:- start:279 stop:617 length:339 start_codon:yes stop_codon:yes gene_type:complete